VDDDRAVSEEIPSGETATHRRVPRAGVEDDASANTPASAAPTGRRQPARDARIRAEFVHTIWHVTGQLDVEAGTTRNNPRISLNHRPTEDLLLYASYSTGALTYAPGTQWQLLFNVTNLTDKLYYTSKTDTRNSFGYASGSVAQPREWIVSIQRNF
jgi:outer membrane receptor protein involved in Fe transport